MKNQFSIGLNTKKIFSLKKSKFNRPRSKKTKTFIEKFIFNRPETKKTKTFIKKTIHVLKTFKIQIIKSTAPSSTIPETRKTKAFIEKSIFNRPQTKKTNTFIEKSIFNRPETKKSKNSHWKNNSALQNTLNSNEKRAQRRFPQCLRPKKHSHWKIYFQYASNQKDKHSHWKNSSGFKTLFTDGLELRMPVKFPIFF